MPEFCPVGTHGVTDHTVLSTGCVAGGGWYHLEGKYMQGERKHKVKWARSVGDGRRLGYCTEASFVEAESPTATPAVFPVYPGNAWSV